jgi:tetratricopeptide (TPR) repeat protein
MSLRNSKRKRRREKARKASSLFFWCGLEFPARIQLPFPDTLQPTRRPWRASAWKEIFACACLILAFGFGPRIAFAQRADFDVILSLIRQRKLQDAEHRLQRYLQTHPASAKANSLLGTVYLMEGRFEQAEAMLERAIAKAPTLIEPRVSLGDAFLAAGKPDSALAAYQGATKITPADARVNLAMAKLYLGKGEFANSLEAAARIPPDKRTPELLPTLAADYFGLDQPEKAGVEIQAMLELSDKHPDLVPELAELFIAHRDFKSSQHLLELAETKVRATDRLHVDMALTQAGLGRLDDAQSTLEAVLERTPDSVTALVAAGQVASQQLNWIAAIEAFTRAASLAPERPDILYGLVSAQLYANQSESALKNAQSLHSLALDDPRSAYVLALALFGTRKWEDAKHYAEKALEAHPEDREMHLILADVALNYEHDLPGARKQTEICLRQNPNDPGALYYLGMAQKMEGDVNGAIQSLARSVSGNPKNADAQSALGTLSLQAGDVPQAVRSLEQAVLLAPDEAQNHYELALGYSRLGVPDKAQAQLKLYSQIKTKQANEAKTLKAPSTSETPHMGIASRP